MPQSYHGISIPGLPNYFQVFGHYGWTGGTWHSVVDTAGAHISRVIAQAQRLGATDVEVRRQAAADWTAQVRGRYATSLFQVGNCATANSYYFDHNGESAYIRPMSTQAARRSSRTFPLHDYAFEGTPSRSGRRLWRTRQLSSPGRGARVFRASASRHRDASTIGGIR